MAKPAGQRGGLINLNGIHTLDETICRFSTTSTRGMGRIERRLSPVLRWTDKGGDGASVLALDKKKHNRNGDAEIYETAIFAFSLFFALRCCLAERSGEAWMEWTEAFSTMAVWFRLLVVCLLVVFLGNERCCCFVV